MADMKQTNDFDDSPIDELVIMRLVDGEVTGAERMEILQRLEQQPGGWRECALAFLEDQVWKQAMALPSASVADAEVVALPTAAVVRNESIHRFMNLGTIATLAAGLLLAFAAGTWMPKRGTGGDGGQPSMEIAEAPVPQSKDTDPNDPRFSVAEAADGVSPLYVIDKEFWDHETSVPQDFQKRLESIGAKVERKRGLMPVRANDGREWIVPYEELDVVPVRDVSM